MCIPCDGNDGFSLKYIHTYQIWCPNNWIRSLCLLRWSCLQTKRVKSETIFISSGSKIVKRLRRRQYDPVIIERTIGLVLGPFTALYGSFLKRCSLTNKAVWTIWRPLSKPPQRRQGPDPRPLWLLVGTPSAFGPELAYRLRIAQPTLNLMDVPIYFWYTIIHVILLYMFVYHIFMTSPLWLAVGPQSLKEDYLQIFKCVSFWLHESCGLSGKVERS